MSVDRHKRTQLTSQLTGRRFPGARDRGKEVTSEAVVVQLGDLQGHWGLIVLVPCSGDVHQHLIRQVANLALLRKAHVRDLPIPLDPRTSANLVWLRDGELELVLQLPLMEEGNWICLRRHVQKDWFGRSANFQDIILHGNRLMMKVTVNWITEKVRRVAKHQAK